MHLPQPDRRPNGRRDCSWMTRFLLGDQIAPGDQIGDQILDGVAPFGQLSGPLKNAKASFDNLIAPGDQIDNLILVMVEFWSPIWSPGPSGRPLGRRSIRSPIWSW